MTAPLTLAGRTLYLAADHAGFAHKQAIMEWLTAESCMVIDSGAFTFDPLDDFPDAIVVAAAAVSAAPSTRAAIIFGGSGQGEAMVANRFAGVRATVYYGGPDEIMALSREHNDANVLSIGARFVSIDDAKKVIWEWLHAPTSTDDKYHRRNRKIEALTKPPLAHAQRAL